MEKKMQNSVVMSRWVASCMIISVMMIASTACVTSSASGNKPLRTERTIQNSNGDVLISLADLLKAPGDFLEQDITVRGKFMGWQGTCNYKPPKSRSDWMLVEEGACIYVNGPTPRSIDFRRGSGDIGQEIDVTGRIRFDKEGRPYLRISAGKRNDIRKPDFYENGRR